MLGLDDVPEKERWWRNAPPSRVIKFVADRHGITVDYMLSTKRSRNVVRAKTAVAKFLRDCKMSFPSIGKLLRLDHSTIQYLVKGKSKKTGEQIGEP